MRINKGVLLLMYKKRIVLNKLLLFTIVGIPILVYAAYFMYEIFPSWESITVKKPDNYSVEKNFSLNEQMLIFVLGWNAINLQTAQLVTIFPMFIMLSLLHFKEDLNSYFIFGKNRFKNYYLDLFKTMIAYSIISAISFTLGHVLIFVIFNQITPLKTDLSLESTLYIFNHLLPLDYFEGRPMYYFITTAIINDIPIMFSYSLLFCVTTLFTKDNLYLFIIVPFVIVYVAIFVNNLFDLTYLNLEVPITGYYSKITDIWKYTIYPLTGTVLGFCYFYMRGETNWKLKRVKV